MRLRAPTLADLPATYAVLEARDVADYGAPDFTMGDLRDAWQRSETDLASDVHVVEEDGRIIGYGMVEAQGAFGVIHPDREARGAGSLLLGRLMERERERGHALHRQYVAATNRSAAELLAEWGYALARSNHRMVRALGPPAPPRGPEPAGGVTLRPLEPSDLEAVHAIDERAFADDPGYVAESLTSFREEHLEGHDSAPDLSLVAVSSGRVAGFLLSRRWSAAGVGYVDVLAVDPDQQGRGIGRSLLLGAFSAYARAGLGEAQLGVSSVNPRALALYESAGMIPRFTSDIYERPTGLRSS